MIEDRQARHAQRMLSMAHRFLDKASRMAPDDQEIKDLMGSVRVLSEKKQGELKKVK